jgi:hypothetical protein
MTCSRVAPGITRRRLFTEAGDFHAGEHTLEIGSENIKEPGAYYCRFYLEDGSFISRKLIKF